jgi:uncharacterized membrane protein YccC
MLLHSELAATELASTVTRLHRDVDLPPGVRSGLLGALDALRRQEVEQARSRTERLAVVVAASASSADPMTAARLGDAVGALRELVDALTASTAEIPEHVDVGIEPAVALFLGHLPGTGPSAIGAIAAGQSWWARRSLNTRLCVQTAIAAPLALAGGLALSPQRYYWALLACFLVLTGTLTTGETAAKGINRIVGTVVGLVAATGAVHLTGGRDGPVVAVMLLCVFVGLYFFRVSYAVMAFAVTTLMGLLYEVLKEFSDTLLGLRVAETALGAGVAIVVALVVLPVRTADARGVAQSAFLTELAGDLADLRDRLAHPGRTSDLYLDARRLDARLLQLALVTRPAGGPTLVGLSSRHAARAVRRWTEVAYRARSLTAEVASLEPGSRPDLAEQVEGLRRRVLGEETAGAAATLTPDGDLVARLLRDLDDAVSRVLPLSSPGRSQAAHLA